jgi:hypothetical protein
MMQQSKLAVFFTFIDISGYYELGYTLVRDYVDDVYRVKNGSLPNGMMCQFTGLRGLV